MATISEYIVTPPNYYGVIFTAPFDCIIGIQWISAGRTLFKRYKNMTADTNDCALMSLSGYATVKISSIIMKQGDMISITNSNISSSSIITGVSA